MALGLHQVGCTQFMAMLDSSPWPFTCSTEVQGRGIHSNMNMLSAQGANMDWRPDYPSSTPPELEQQHAHDQALHSPYTNNQTGYTPKHSTAARPFSTRHTSSDSSADGLSGCAGPLAVPQHPAAAAIQLLKRASSSTLGCTASHSISTSGADAAAADNSSSSNATRQQLPVAAAAPPARQSAVGRLDAAALKALMAACSPSKHSHRRALHPQLEQQHSAPGALEQQHSAPGMLQRHAAAHIAAAGPRVRPNIQERAPAAALAPAQARGRALAAPKAGAHAAWGAGAVPTGYVQAAAAAAASPFTAAAQAAAEAYAARLQSHSSDPTSAAVGPRPGVTDGQRININSTSLRTTFAASQLYGPADGLAEAEQAPWPQHGRAPQQQWVQPQHVDAHSAGRPALRSPLHDNSRSADRGYHLQPLRTASTTHARPMAMQDTWPGVQDSAVRGQPPGDSWQQQKECWDDRLAMLYSNAPAQRQPPGAARWSTPMPMDRIPGGVNGRRGFGTMSGSSEQYPCSEQYCADMGPSARSFPAAGMDAPSRGFPARSSFQPGSRTVGPGGWAADEMLPPYEYASSAPCECWECRMAIAHGRLPPSDFSPPGAAPFRGYFPPNHAAPGFNGRGPFPPGQRFPAQYGPGDNSGAVRLAGPDCDSNPGASYSLPERRRGGGAGPPRGHEGAQVHCAPWQQPPSTLHQQDGRASAFLGPPLDRGGSLAARPDSWTACEPACGPHAAYGPGPVRTKSLPAHAFSQAGARISTASRTHPYDSSAHVPARTASSSILELRRVGAAEYGSNSRSIEAFQRQPAVYSPVRGSVHMRTPQGLGGPWVHASTNLGLALPPDSMHGSMTAGAVSAGLSAPGSSMQQCAAGAAAAAGGADGQAPWPHPSARGQHGDAAVLHTQQPHTAGAPSSMQLPEARNLQHASLFVHGRSAQQQQHEVAADGLGSIQTMAASAAAARRVRSLQSSSLHAIRTSQDAPSSVPDTGAEASGAVSYRQPAGNTGSAAQDGPAAAPSHSNGAGNGRTTPDLQRCRQDQHMVTDPFFVHSAAGDRHAAAQVQHRLPPRKGSGTGQPGGASSARIADQTQQQTMQVQTLPTSLPTVSTPPAHQQAGDGALQHQIQQEPSQGLGDHTPDQHTLLGHPFPGQQRMNPGPLTILQGTVVGSTEASQPATQAAAVGDAPAASAPASAAPAGEAATASPAAADKEVWGFGDSMADLLMGLGDEPLNLEEIDSLLSPFDIELDMQDMQ